MRFFHYFSWFLDAGRCVYCIPYTVYSIPYSIPNKLFRLSIGTCGKNVGLYGDHERPNVPSSRGSAHRFVEHMTLGAVWCTQGRPVRPPLDDLFVFTIHLHLTTQILCMRDSIHSGGLDGNSSWSTPPCIAVSSFGLACASSLARQQLN